MIQSLAHGVSAYSSLSQKVGDNFRVACGSLGGEKEKDEAKILLLHDLAGKQIVLFLCYDV